MSEISVPLRWNETESPWKKSNRKESWICPIEEVQRFLKREHTEDWRLLCNLWEGPLMRCNGLYTYRGMSKRGETQWTDQVLDSLQKHHKQMCSVGKYRKWERGDNIQVLFVQEWKCKVSVYRIKTVKVETVHVVPRSLSLPELEAHHCFCSSPPFLSCRDTNLHTYLFIFLHIFILLYIFTFLAI